MFEHLYFLKRPLSAIEEDTIEDFINGVWDEDEVAYKILESYDEPFWIISAANRNGVPYLLLEIHASMAEEDQRKLMTRFEEIVDMALEYIDKIR